MTAPRVLIVEDHALLVEALASALRQEGFEVRAAHTDLREEHVLDLAASFGPDVVLLDLDLGEGRTGLPLIAALKGAARVVMLTGSTDRRLLAECVEAGAECVVDKTAPLGGLVDVVRRAAAGEAVLGLALRAELLADLRARRREERHRLAPFERLTAREAEVLGAILEGLSAEEIGEAHFLAESTVRTHIRGILSKLGVSSQLAAAAMARRVGWRPPGAAQSDEDRQF